MTQVSYQAVSTVRETSEEFSVKAWHFLAGGLVSFLFLAAVVAASVTIQASYELARLQNRQRVALQQQQLLRERLAEATSLAQVEAYAQQNGFTTPANRLAELAVTLPVAQR